MFTIFMLAFTAVIIAVLAPLWPALMVGSLTGITPAIVDMINQLIASFFGG